jgi:DNA repair exonuclease SbcCD ATPase subunit
LQDSKNLVSKIDDLKSTSGTNTDDVIKDIGVLEDKLKNLKSEFIDIKQQAFASNIISELLKDTGIKSDIIKQYIPLLVAFTNQYLEKMNIPLKFDMDENFSETITTRFANEFTYNNLSAGERARLDFSLQMAWREIARIKGSVDTNLLVLDEMLDANLDEAGTTAALDIINELSISHNVNVFIVSHKSNLEEYVRSVLKLEKVNGFTKIV